MNDTVSERPLAIVLGRNYASRLGMTRAAGMAGCDVVVVRTHLKWMEDETADTYSKYVVDSSVANEPYFDKLVDAILSFTYTGRKAIILPTDDWTAAVVDRHLNLLSPHFLTPHVLHRQEAMLSLMDKENQKAMAREAGANVAEGWVCRNTDNGYTIPEGISFPCFTKPVESHTGALKPYLKRCDNLKQLKDVLDAIGKKYKKDILVEQFLNIEKEYAVLGVAFGGHCLMPAFIQMDASREGVTATGWVRPMTLMPQMERILKKFMAKTQLTGLFDIDLYESNGKIYFNELNTRFGASGYAVTMAACNLPAIFIQQLMGLPTQHVPKEFAEKSFANEKICFDMLHTGLTSYTQYKRQIRNADILFIEDIDDPKPMLYMQKKNRLLFARYLFWTLRRKLKISKGI